MKKLTVKMTYDTVVALDEWLGSTIQQMPTDNFSGRCIAATLIEWRVSKLFPKTAVRTDKVILKLNAATAMALGHMIMFYGHRASGQIGNCLRMIKDEAHQHFS